MPPGGMGEDMYSNILAISAKSAALGCTMQTVQFLAEIRLRIFPIIRLKDGNKVIYIPFGAKIPEHSLKEELDTASRIMSNFCGRSVSETC
jgi:hypothetical protein